MSGGAWLGAIRPTTASLDNQMQHTTSEMCASTGRRRDITNSPLTMRLLTCPTQGGHILRLWSATPSKCVGSLPHLRAVGTVSHLRIQHCVVGAVPQLRIQPCEPSRVLGESEGKIPAHTQRYRRTQTHTDAQTHTDTQAHTLPQTDRQTHTDTHPHRHTREPHARTP